VITRRLIAIAGACFAALLSMSCSRNAPEVSMTLTTGERVALGELRGRLVWLEFWSLSCAPCIEELPAMRLIYDQLDRRNMTTIAVAMPWDPPAPVADFVTREKLPWPVALDVNSAVANAFDVRAVPYRVLIGRNGKIIHSESGRLDAEAWRARIEALLH
jgi:peroxiredoxin